MGLPATRLRLTAQESTEREITPQGRFIAVVIEIACELMVAT
jgi:hypothetical protein